MFLLIKKFIRELFTENDNQTYDLTRFLAFLGGMVMLICQCYAVYKSGTFSAVDFGTGFSAYMAGAGIGIGFKTKLEGASNATKSDN